MRISRHEKSYIVELNDGSAWRIWPGDLARTLDWRPTTEIDVVEIQHEICSHALLDRSGGLAVRAIPASAEWRSDAVCRLLKAG